MATAVEAAKHICLSPSRFRDLVALGVFKRVPSGMYDLDVIRETYCLHAQKVMAGRSDDGGGSLAKQRTRLEAAKTEAVLHKNAINRGDLVSLKVIRKVGEAMMGNFRSRCLSIPGSMADALTPYTPQDRDAIHEILREKIYEALDQLSDPDFPGWGPMTRKVEEAAA